MNVLYIEDYAIDAELVRDALIRRAPDIRLDVVSTVSDAIVRLNRFELAHHGQLIEADPVEDLSYSFLTGDAPRYDLVLTDLNLPDGTGLDILAHIRKRNLMVAVVILTGSGQEDAVYGALHAGADDYVTKSGDFLSVLPATLRSALNHFKLETVRLSQIIRVLYAEPNRADVELTQRHLRQRARHIEIESVQSAGEVLERLASTTEGQDEVDVLLLDYRLPGMTAIDLVKELHQVQGMDLPIVLVTGHGSEEIARLALKLGVQEYMVKSAGYLERLPFALENAFYRKANQRERLALLKSEREFHSLADNLPDVIARFDRDKRHLYVNPAIENFSGIPAPIYIGLKNSELGMPADMVAFLDNALEKVFINSVQEKINFTFAGVNGEQIFESLLVPEKTPSGTVETVLAIARNITDRWMAEQGLRKRGRQLQTLIDNFPGMVSHVDRNLRYLNVNDVLVKVLGIPKEKLLSMSLRDLLKPENWAEAEPEFERVFAGEKIAHEIIFADQQTGDQKYALLTMVPDVAEDGTVQGLFHFHIDITDLKLTQLALQRREAEMRLIADQFPGILSRLDRDLRIVFANAQHEKLYGLPLDQIVGLTIGELSGERFGELEPYYRRALAGERVSYEANRELAPGQIIYWFVTLVPDVALDQTVQGVIVSALDITDRKKTELVVLEREQELSVITNQFPGTIARLDRDLRYRYVNDAVVAIYQRSKEEILGQKMMDIIGPERFARIEEDLSRTLAGERRVINMTLSDPSGEQRYTIINMIPDLAADGSVQGLFNIILDITETRRAEMGMRERERELSVITGQFPGVIARLDGNLCYQYANEAYATSFQRTVEEMIGRTHLEMLGPENFAKSAGDFARVLNGERIAFDRSFTYPSGKTLHYIINLVPDTGDDGSIHGVFIIGLDITKIRQAELSAMEREQHLSIISNNFPGLIGRLDRDLRFLFSNTQFSMVFGRNGQPLNGLLLKDVIGLEAYAFGEPFFKRALAGEACNAEDTIRGPDGSPRHGLLNFVPDPAPDGTIRGVIFTVVDISDRKLMENELREREHQLSVIADNFPGVISRLDRDFRILFANSHHEEEFGASRESMVGRLVPELIGKERFAGIEHHYQKALRGERVMYENTQINPAGETTYWIINLIPDFAPDKIVQGVFVNAIDITQRKRSEIAREHSEARVTGLINSAMDAIVAVDEKQQIILFNPAAERIFGYAAQEIQGESVDRLLPERLRARHYGLIQNFGQSNAAGRRMSSQDVWGLRKDGSEFPLEASISQMDSPTGRVYTAILRDITERVKAEQAMRQRELQLSMIATNFPGLISRLDRNFRILFANAFHERIHGVPPEKLVGMRLIDSVGEERFAPMLPHLSRALMGERVSYENIGRDALGTTMHWLVNLVPDAAPDGTIQGVFVSALDITERKNQERNIQRLSRMQAMHTEISSAVVRIHEKQTLLQEVCRIVVERSSLGMAWIALLDETVNELVMTAWWGAFDSKLMTGYRIPLDGGPLTQTAAPQAILTGKTVVVNNIEVNVRAGYLRQEAIRLQYRSIIALPLVIETKPVGVFVLYATEEDFFNDEEVRLLEDLSIDISVGLEYLAKAEHINYLAYNDKLTGLPNRISLQERLERLSNQKKLKGTTGLVKLDIARFRLINDSFGRHSGDEVIKLVTARLLGGSMPVENLARAESNTFVIILHDVADEQDLLIRLEGILQAVFGSPFRIASNEFHLKAKCGAVLFGPEDLNIELMLRHAELALARAKKSIENIVVYRTEMDERSVDALNLETRLRRALELEQFVLYYQPKWDSKDKKIASVEALIRWQDPDKGLIPPGLFIPALEKTGMIFEVGRWVLRQAAKDYKIWLEKGFIPPRIAVNVSSLQLGHHNFVPDLKAVAQAAGQQDSGIDLEITESVIMDNLNENIAKLNAARALGMSIAIDDFGTGYSSLSYLAKLPVNTLKIDRSFVIEMATGEQGRQLVAAIITLAHTLKLKVVAEGVETEEQLKILEELDCDQIQGYLISRPIPASELEKLLTLKKPKRAKKKT